MKKDQFLAILQRDDAGAIVYDVLKNYAKDISKYLSQYDPLQHDVAKLDIRKDKYVMKPDPSGIVDPITGEVRLVASTVRVARIPLALQKEIVKVAASMLCATPVTLDYTEENDTVRALQKIWNDNKLDYKNLRLLKLLLAETECAELWYKDAEGNNKMLILSQSYGDTLYPVFDDLGKLVAFGRSYTAKRFDETSSKLKDISVYEVYTETQVYIGDNSTGQLVMLPPKTHKFNKIPVIYHSQQYPEWYDVQAMIERLETLISNNADTNDYFGSPTAVASGNILSYADKGESGKMVQVDVGGKIEYLTWDQVPAAIKLEIDTIIRFIYAFSSTIDISSEGLKAQFGQAPSTYVVKLLFASAHMKAAEHEENFGEGLQRRINLLLDDIKDKKTQIKPKFTKWLPVNEAEEVTTLVAALNGGIVSQETAVKKSPFTVDTEDELGLIQQEQKQSQQNTNSNDTNTVPGK